MKPPPEAQGRAILRAWHFSQGQGAEKRNGAVGGLSRALWADDIFPTGFNHGARR
jgi:hypothetical protein